MIKKKKKFSMVMVVKRLADYILGCGIKKKISVAKYTKNSKNPYKSLF